jgi:hypothetical protein
VDLRTPLCYTLAMPIAILILQLLPYVLQAVVAVEQALPNASGTTKKAVVMSTVDAATQAGTQVSPDAVKALAAAVDSLVAVLNQSSVFTHTSARAA